MSRIKDISKQALEQLNGEPMREPMVTLPDDNQLGPAVDAGPAEMLRKKPITEQPEQHSQQPIRRISRGIPSPRFRWGLFLIVAAICYLLGILLASLFIDYGPKSGTQLGGLLNPLRQVLKL